MRYLGVDLAWGEGSEAKPANRSGVVALEPSGAISDAGWRIGLEATIDWIQQHAADDALLFVDAPLVITNPTGPRLADRQTGQRYGRWWVSANSVNLSSPRQAGVHLRERLEALGWHYCDGRGGPPSRGSPSSIRPSTSPPIQRRAASSKSLPRQAGATTSCVRICSTRSSAPGPPPTGTAAVLSGTSCLACPSSRAMIRSSRRSSRPRVRSSAPRETPASRLTMRVPLLRARARRLPLKTFQALNARSA